MTVEDRLREALRSRADGVIASQPEWSRVADRLGRPRRRRLRFVTPALAAVAALVVAVVAWIDSESDGSRPLRTAGPSPTATLPVPPADGRVPRGFRPISATWISPLQGWVLGESLCSDPPCPSLLRTTDGGATWTGGPAPRAGAGRSAIRFADERNGWIYGEELWATHNAGSTWTHVERLPGKVTSLESSEDRAWATLESAGAGSVFTSAVGTDEWRPASGPVRPAGSLVLHGAGGYVLGVDGSVLALSHPGGPSRPGEPGVLERRGTPCGGAPASLAPAGSDLMALCAGAAALGSSTKTLLVSSDGARTWTTAGSPPRAGSAGRLAAASRSTLVVAVASGSSVLYRSDDGGATWTTVYDDATFGGAEFHDLGFTSASRGTAMLGNRLLQTTDGGRTWSPVAFTS